MKNIILIIGFLIYWGSLFSQIKNDLTNLKLNGEIKSVSVYLIQETKNSETEKHRSKTLQINFNEFGNITERKEYYYNNDLYSKEIREYSVNGNLLNSTIYYFKNDSIISSEKRDINEIKKELNSDNIVKIFPNKEYDKNGNITLDKWFDSNEKLTDSITYKYDNNNNLIEMFHYDSNGKILQTRTNTYKYDNQNNIIENQVYDSKEPNKRYIYIINIEYY